MYEELRDVRVETKADYSIIGNAKYRRTSIGLFDFFVFMLSVVGTGIFIFFNNKEYCTSIGILPVLFGICYSVFAAPIIRSRKSLTMMFFSICEFLRCVFMPVFIAFSDYTGFGVFSTNDSGIILEAVLLMAWEMIVVFIFLHVYIRNHHSVQHKEHDVVLAENKYAIYLIILIGIAIYFASPQVRRYINFLSLSSASDKVRDVVAGGNSSVFTGLLTYVHDAFLCIFILVLDANARKFKSSGKRTNVWIPTFVGLVTVAVIFGESRATIVYTLFAVISCLQLKYHEYGRRIILVLILGAAAVLVGMTVYRLFAVYNFSSYAAAIANGGYMGQNYLARFMEGYLLGPQSIAAGIVFKAQHLGDFTFERFFFDLFRPFMGFNLILQRSGMDTSITLYNSWLTGIAGRSNGYFLQITNQCYCYLGFFLSPLFVCLFMWISVRLENWRKRTRNLFVYFFISYVFIRTSTCVLGGTMSGYITNSSMTLLVCGFFFLMQRAFSSLIIRR